MTAERPKVMLVAPQSPHHLLSLNGVYVDRPGQGLKPRCIKIEPPTDADIAQIVQTTGRRVIRKLP
jgi:hypothetical protein